MRKIIKLLIIFLALVTQLSAQSEKKNTDPTITIDGKPIETTINQEELKEKLAKIEKTIKKNPDNSQLYSAKALLLINQKNVDGAIEAMDKAIELESGSIKLVGMKGFFYYLKDDTINAYRCFDEVVAIIDASLNDPAVESYEKMGNMVDKYYFIYLKDKNKEKYISSLKAEFAKLFDELENPGNSENKESNGEDILSKTILNKEFIDAYVEKSVNDRDISKEGIWRFLEISGAMLIKLQLE